MGRLSKIKRELIQEANKRLLGEHGNSETGHYQVKLDMCKTNYNDWCCMTAMLDWTLITAANAGSIVGTKVKYNSNLPTHQNEPEHPAGECGIISDIRPWVYAQNQNITCANYIARLTTMSNSEYDDCCVPTPKGCMDPNALNHMECCDGDPNCVPTINTLFCCKYADKGCMDSTALNYNECCPSPVDYVNSVTGGNVYTAFNWNDGVDPDCEPTEHKPDCCKHMRYRCKGPIRQATTGVSIRERANIPTTSSCVEDENGEFASLQACRESCEAGYGPGYIPDAGTAEG